MSSKTKHCVILEKAVRENKARAGLFEHSTGTKVGLSALGLRSGFPETLALLLGKIVRICEVAETAR